MTHQPNPNVYTIPELKEEFSELRLAWLGHISTREFVAAKDDMDLINMCLDLYNEKVAGYAEGR